MAKLPRHFVWLGLGGMILIGGFGLWRNLTHDDGRPQVAGGGVQAPWMDSDGIHFRGKTFKPADIQPGSADLNVESVAVTRDGLIASVPEQADENPDSTDEEPWSALFELPLDGKVRKVTTRRLGTAMGDVRGSTVAWAEPSGGGIKLVAYDTAHHRFLRTLHVRDDSLRIYVVDDAKVYLMGDGVVALWDTSASKNRLADVPNFPKEAGLVTDAHDGALFVSTDGETSQIVSANGKTLGLFDELYFATFSPDGQHVAATKPEGGFSDESRAFVWSVAKSAEVPLQLPANANVIELQWESDGDLLVLSQPAGDIDDASREIRSCSPASGACARFTDGRWLHTTSALDQFAYDAY